MSHGYFMSLLYLNHIIIHSMFTYPFYIDALFYFCFCSIIMFIIKWRQTSPSYWRAAPSKARYTKQSAAANLAAFATCSKAALKKEWNTSSLPLRGPNQHQTSSSPQWNPIAQWKNWTHRLMTHRFPIRKLANRPQGKNWDMLNGRSADWRQSPAVKNHKKIEIICW